MDDQSQFADTLRRYMQVRAWTASDLARAAGLHRATLHHWLHGTVRQPTQRVSILRAGAALGLYRAQLNLLLHLAELPSLSSEELSTRSAEESLAAGMARWRDVARNNLPVAGTLFIGRTREVVELAACLADRDVRLLTLVGPAGVGKTRLAVRAAEDLLDAFPDGVYFVDLAALADADEVLPAIMRVIGLGQTASAAPRERLATYLRDRSVLLVLDNCEHVLNCAPELAGLLGEARGLSILATSRERLRLSSEQVIEVQPLPLPPPQSRPVELRRQPAVALFIARAALLRPTFRPGPAALRGIAELCRELDGLPLAIELAAGRAAVLEPEAIARQLGARLDLATDTRDVPERQRSLRAAIEWSVRLLADGDLALFRALAVFSGGWDAGAAAHVYEARPAQVEEALQRLAAASLIQAVPSTSAPRWRMLETMRAYAAEQLAATGDEPRLRRGHAEHYLAVVEAAPRYVIYPTDEVWYQQIDVEYGNVTAALRWVRVHDPVLLMRFAAALWPYWHERMLARDGLAWIEEVAQVNAAPHDVLEGELALGRCFFQSSLGFETLALDTGSQALALFQSAGERHGEATALQRLALTSHHLGQFRVAFELATRALACWEALDHPLGLAWSHGDSGFILATQGEFAAAKAHLDAAQPIYLELGNQRGLMRVATERGMVALLQGAFEQASAHLRDGIELGRDLPRNFILHTALFYLSLAHLFMDRIPEAHAYQRQSLLVRRDAGDRLGLGYNILAFAAIAVRLNQIGLAARWCGAAYALMAEMGIRMNTMAQAIYDRETSQIVHTVGQAAFDAEFSVGCTLSLDLVMDEALRLTIE